MDKRPENENKSKIMIFNFTKKYQFSSRLSIENQNLETVSETKLLGTIITDDLKWNKNTALIVKKCKDGTIEENFKFWCQSR